MGQAPQAGLRAWQMRRPWKITWCESIVQSLLGKSAPTAASILSGSVCLGPLPAPHQPLEVRVHGDAGAAEGVAEHDEGGLAAHAGQLDEVLEAAGNLAAELLHAAPWTALSRDLVLARKKPVGRRISSTSSGSAAARSSGVGYLAKSAGVVWLTLQVGGLGGQDRGDHELEGVLEVQLRVGVRIHLARARG